MLYPPTLGFSAGLMIGLVAAAWSVCGTAADLGPQLSAGKAAASSSAQSGRKLTWLPYRPSVPAADRSAVARQSSVPVSSKPLVRTAQRPRGEAFEDPFGDTADVQQVPRLAAAADQRVPGVRLPGDELPGNSQPMESLLGGAPSGESLPDEPPMQPTLEGLGPDLPFDAMPGAAPEVELDRSPLSSIAGPYAQDLLNVTDECPSPTDPAFHTAIGDLSTDITAEEGNFPRECLLTEETIEPFGLGKLRHNSLRQPWDPTTFTWKASALCHKPLYFEEVHVERYGHSWGPYLQPLASGAHFFLTVPALPYKMGLYPPCECIYTLGYYRPGSCAPRMLDPLPLSVRAALAEGGVWTGMAFLIP